MKCAALPKIYEHTPTRQPRFAPMARLGSQSLSGLLGIARHSCRSGSAMALHLSRAKTLPRLFSGTHRKTRHNSSRHVRRCAQTFRR